MNAGLNQTLKQHLLKANEHIINALQHTSKAEMLILINLINLRSGRLNELPN